MNVAAPYYLHRPSQIARRIFRRGRSPARTPWGLLIECDPHESIGSALVRNGVYDLAATEHLWRLTDEGDICIDVGANIGYMTSVLARRSGPAGLVIAFEPHPAIGARLARSARVWQGCATVDIRQCALSDTEGSGTLAAGVDFALNNGTARIAADLPGVSVRLETLDRVLAANMAVGVMKIDVEGHELRVLEGGARTLAAGLIRDVLYEDLGGYPTPVSELLERAGYTVFAVRSTFWGPQLLEPHSPTPANEAPNYLATRAPQRAVRRMKTRGWCCLRG